VTAERFIGLDVGGTKIATAVLENGTFETFDPIPTRTHSGAQLIEQIVGEIDRYRGSGACAVAVGLPSVIDTASGAVNYTVNLPLRHVPLRDELSARCGLPVYVENDASCAALAEAQEAGRIICENLVMFTIGTGVGGGLVIGGKLYRGATSAVELGHTLIALDLADGAPAEPGRFPQPGSLEMLASGRALDRLALESARAHPESFLGERLAHGEEITGHDAVEGARADDVHCRHVLRVLGERLGIGIANAINTFDPDEVVIGGGVSLAGDLLLVPAERAARRHTVPGLGLHTKVRLARHGPQAGVLGAATVAAQEWAHRSVRERPDMPVTR
jgi:glucokinase